MPRNQEELWVIQYEDVDPSRDGIVAYHSRAEAVEAAADFARTEAVDELDNLGERDLNDEDTSIHDLLEGVIEDATAGRFDDAVRQWLAYQNAANPNVRIAIGPSGSVSASEYDFE